jgi:S-adenosyl-L-methionine hydrolase (adenosine-forming)
VPRPILFLSDYGLDDEFVGVCHVILAGLAPDVRVIDLTHGVPPMDIARGAIVLADVAPHAPPNSVFLAVVDPGVGTARLPVAVGAGAAFLVGPDNGLLSLAWEALGGASRAVVIDSDEIVRVPMSETFHGRDVFAPAAAHLATGGSLEFLGSERDPSRLKRIFPPTPTLEPGVVRSHVLSIDRFGNVQLSAREEDLRKGEVVAVGELDVRIGDETFTLTRARTFGDVPKGKPALIQDSSGRLAIVVNGGSAAEALNLKVGESVDVRRPRS